MKTASKFGTFKVYKFVEKKEKPLLVTPAFGYFRGVPSVNAVINNSNF